GDDRAQPLLDEVQPDVGAARPLGAGADLAPGVAVPVQLRPDRTRVHRPCQGHRARRGVRGGPLVTLVTRGQLQPSRAHPCTAFRSPGTPRPDDQGDYSASGARCSPMDRVVSQLPHSARSFRATGPAGVIRLIVARAPPARLPLASPGPREYACAVGGTR